MLTSFFRKSGPLNFLLVGLYILLFACLWYFLENKGSLDLYEIGKISLSVLLWIFSIFLLDFIIRKNGLTQINGYALLFFGVLICFFPAILLNVPLLGANVCLLFALRRIFSLHSMKNTERKILDAALWIAIATFLYSPSILMVVALLWAIVMMPTTKLRYLFIPVAGFIAVLLLVTAYYLLKEDSFLWITDHFGIPSWNFSAYGTLAFILGIAFVLGSLVWALFFKIGTLSKIPKKERPRHLLVIYVLLVSVAITITSNTKDTSELVFMIAPTAIIMANYLEHNSEKWFKEILLWGFIVYPFVLFFV